jgi:hypothetical protein
MKGTIKNMKRILNKLMLALSSVVVMGGLSLAVALPAHAQTVNCDEGVGRGVALTSEDGNTCTDSGEGEGSFSSVIKKVINIFSIVVGAVSVIMIIIGGFRYIVSNGDSNGVSGAKNTILYAVVGLVIVLFAQVIVRFVLTNVSSQ